MIKNTLIEVCCGSIEDVALASQFPVDRIELNSALELGGLTPSMGTLKQAVQCSRLPICCMVRPRTSGFHYTEDQFDSMCFDAEMLISGGAAGIVFGFLDDEMCVNEKWTKRMVQIIHSYGREAIFHKAFDAIPDKDEACKMLIACCVDRILTSGGENYPDIEKGFPTLKHLIETYNDQITILVGGGVRAHNVRNILTSTKCTEIHMTAKEIANDNGDYVRVSEQNLEEILENF